MNRNYISGRKAEYRSMRYLEALGYRCTRSASSKGAYDVIGVKKDSIILVQVKRSPRRPRKAEREKLAALEVPPCAEQVIHWWKPGASEPVVISIGG